MTDDALSLGGGLLIFGFTLNIASPHLSPLLDANLGLWGGVFVLIGIIVIATRLNAMTR